MVLSVEPEFESIEYESPVSEEAADGEKPAVFSEEDHLKDVTEPIIPFRVVNAREKIVTDYFNSTYPRRNGKFQLRAL
jgi:hypothetical protein